MTGQLLAKASLSTPDAPLSVNVVYGANLDGSVVNLTQEPSFSLIKVYPWATDPQFLTLPTTFRPSGQDLVYGGYGAVPPGQVPLYVLSAFTSKSAPTNVELLSQIQNPRLVIPQQEAVFDSADPFFVADPARCYFVQPHYYTVSSSPQELDNLAYIPQWSTRFKFSAFYHPFARTFLREIEIGGLDRLMSRNLQTAPLVVRNQNVTDFKTQYVPQPPVARPYPVEDVDFAADGAYAAYNWEIFYHAPMFVASQLMRNQQFDAAMHWLEYIFDPTDTSAYPAPQKFWRTKPFFAMNANDWLSQQIQQILQTLAADAQMGIADPATAAAIQDWLAHPFDPHRVARLRIGAYGKATVMRFLDNLVAWGDSLYTSYTMENVAQAEQLYVFADLILGPRPEQVRVPDADLVSKPDATTYADIESALDKFSDTLAEIENVIASPSTDLGAGDPATGAPGLPNVATGTIETLFFCIPVNDQLLAYWATVADRLYKIRHCLNLQGVAQPLPLYAPPINPLQLIGQAAGGSATLGAPSFTPIYRFATYLERAFELTNDVRAYGALVLAALEKKDAEGLSTLRASQDLDIQSRILSLKTQAVDEAQEQVTVLQKQQAVVQIRHDFYSNVAFMNDWETAAVALQVGALIANGLAVVLDLTAGPAALIPSFSSGMAGFGGSPTLQIGFSGAQAGASAASFASAARGVAGLLSEAGGIASTMGNYQRRKDDWELQANLATAELAQLDSQIAAAIDRLTIASSEVDLQTRQIANAQAVSDFLTAKYTNTQLYDWILTQLTTVHTQAYQLAFSLAQQAQAAFQYELGSLENFVQFGYWDSAHKGLMAGDSLLFDLRRMQAQYLAENTREIELVKHVSLALYQPMALVQLLQTGTCNFSLDEQLFDRDNPGNYFRRLRSVALTIPCVTGPYTGVNATLTLNAAIVRVQPPVSPYVPASASAPPGGSAFVTSVAPSTAMMSTSHGQNDAGLFEVNLRDDRWLPFEGQGTVSTWTLSLDSRDNAFDIPRIPDIVVSVRLTARAKGGNPEAVRQALKPLGARQILVSVRNTFSNEYYAFFNPSAVTSALQTLSLPLTEAVFPYSNLGTVTIADIVVVMMVNKAPAAGTSIASSFGPVTAPLNTLPITAAAGTTSAGLPIKALSADASLASALPPGVFSLVVPESSVPAALGVSSGGHLRLDSDQFEDILLVIDYGIA